MAGPSTRYVASGFANQLDVIIAYINMWAFEFEQDMLPV